jgi:hypothetical protein
VANTPFIDKKTAVEAFDESRKWLRPYHDPIEELERLARNKPSSKIVDHLPKVTDGTLSAINQETPKRIIQQPPTGLLTCKQYPEYAKIADIELRYTLIPSYNKQGDILQKSWLMSGKSMTYGKSSSYTFYTQTNGKLHTDFTIIYPKDDLTEKGKVFAPDCNIRFIRSWYQKRDIDGIIQRERKFEQQIKGYTSEWDLVLLAKLKDSGASAKPGDLQTPAEREKGGDNGGYEIIHAFQKGIEAEFYSFSPQFESGKPLRVKKNNDPRGLLPIDDLYCNIDLSNPMGRGIIEASAGTQNLIDQQMQMYQFISTLMMGPPLQVWGSVNRASLKFRPNALWDMGRNANSNQNRVEPYKVDNAAIGNFVGNMQWLQSKLYNLNSSNDTSISSENGNVGQSKTQAGVKAQDAKLGVSDNYLRKQYEAWYQAQSETSTNIYFSEMKGEQKLKLEPADVKELLKTDAKKFLHGNELTISYKDITKVSFAFESVAGSSEVKENEDNAEKLTQVYQIMSSDPDPAIQEKKTKVLKLLIDEIGAEGTDDLFPEQELDENGQVADQPQQQPPAMQPEQIQQLVMQTVQQAMQQAEEAKKQQPKSISESLQIKFADLPEDAKQQVLQQIGIQTTMVTPQTQKDNADMVLKADKQAHDTQLAVASHDHSVEQAKAQQELSQKQSAQQQTAATAKQQSGTDTEQPVAGQLPQDGALSPDEQEFVEALLNRNFEENDVEQAVVMKRQGMPLEQIIQTLGAKHA